MNWTRIDTQSVGWEPNSNESLVSRGGRETSGEESFTGSSASFAITSTDANWLVLSNGSQVEVSALDAKMLQVSPSTGEEWSGGIDGRSEGGVSMGTRLHGTYDVAEGAPTFRFAASRQIHVQGDFIVFVWGSFVNVTDAEGGSSSFRSGAWDSDEIGQEAHPRGVARSEHSQLIRLQVTGGRLLLEEWEGLGRFAVDALGMATTETVLFDNATAYLESNEYYYTTTDEPLELAGPLELDIRSSSGSARLSASIIAGATATTLPPSGRIAPAAPVAPEIGDGEAPDPNSQVRVDMNTPDSPSLVLFGLLAILLLLLGGWLLLLRRRASRANASAVPGAGALFPNEIVLRAEDALARGESARARSIVRSVIKKDPLNIEAWFVHGASLVQQGAFEKASEALEPIVTRVRGNRTGLAFLLALSFLRINNLGKARRWSRVAAADPDFRHVMDLDEAFQRLGWRSSDVGAGPGVRPTADKVDVAYG